MNMDDFETKYRKDSIKLMVKITGIIKGAEISTKIDGAYTTVEDVTAYIKEVHDELLNHPIKVRNIFFHVNNVLLALLLVVKKAIAIDVEDNHQVNESYNTSYLHLINQMVSLNYYIEDNMFSTLSDDRKSLIQAIRRSTTILNWTTDNTDYRMFGDDWLEFITEMSELLISRKGIDNDDAFVSIFQSQISTNKYARMKSQVKCDDEQSKVVYH